MKNKQKVKNPRQCLLLLNRRANEMQEACEIVQRRKRNKKIMSAKQQSERKGLQKKVKLRYVWSRWKAKQSNRPRMSWKASN